MINYIWYCVLIVLFELIFMDWINKHRGIVVVVVLIIFCWPVIVNWLYNVETNCKVLHKPQEWTMFWGSYIGSIVSAAVAFIILHLQREDNSKENESNRKLQLKILEQQQEMQWLNTFRKVCIECISSYSAGNIRNIVNKVKFDPSESFFLIKAVGDRMREANLKIKIIWKENKNNLILNKIRIKHNLIVHVLNDMSCIIGYFIRDEYASFLYDFQESPEYKYTTLELKEIVKKKTVDIESEVDNLMTLRNKEFDKNIMFKIISERFEIYLNNNIDIETLLSDYIKEQEDRIEQILKQDTK